MQKSQATFLVAGLYLVSLNAGLLKIPKISRPSPFLLAECGIVPYLLGTRILNRDASWLRLIEVIVIKTSGWRALTLLQLLLGKDHLPYLEDEGKCHQENGYCREDNENLFHSLVPVSQPDEKVNTHLVVPEDIPRCNISTIIQQCSHILRLMLFDELL
jgi:hypothetical protein